MRSQGRGGSYIFGIVDIYISVLAQIEVLITTRYLLVYYGS